MLISLQPQTPNYNVKHFNDPESSQCASSQEITMTLFFLTLVISYLSKPKHSLGRNSVSFINFQYNPDSYT